MIHRRIRVATWRVLCLIVVIKVSIDLCVPVAVLSALNNQRISASYILDNFAEYDDVGHGSIYTVKKQQIIQKTLPSCSDQPQRLIGNVSFAKDPPDLRIVGLLNQEVKDGTYFPKHCKARSNVAIIIPFRGRENNLRYMLSHMHPIWQRQEISYTVFTISQAGMFTFNKAKLMNAGFMEAKSYGDFDCFVFHDVDALLEDDRCLYWCQNDNPRHLCVHADTFNYKEIWYFSKCRAPGELFTQIKLFGGVTMFTAEQFIKINGFSNLYWGWGGEDDDMYKRLANKGYKAANPYGRHCSYTLLQHPRDSTNAPSNARESLIYHSTVRQDKEGLSTLRYKVLSYEYHPLFVNITVDVGRPSPKMQRFIDSSKGSWLISQCIARMPWNL